MERKYYVEITSLIFEDSSKISIIVDEQDAPTILKVFGDACLITFKKCK